MSELIPHIRPETASDLSAIEAVTIAAFLSAPHTSHTEQFIVRELRSAGVLTISLVAESASGIIGHVAISPISISDGTEGWYGLGPVSVLPQHQHRGIGSRLILEVLAGLKIKGAKGCVVLGEPAYYRRFGFQAQSNLFLPAVPPEYFMALPLSDSSPKGIVTYHAAFAATT